MILPQQQKRFDLWSRVPENLATRNRLERRFLRVRPHSVPSAHYELINESGHLILIPLYDENQCQKFCPSERTEAVWELEDIFLSHCNRNDYIRFNRQTNSWYSFKSYLRRENFVKHLNQKEILGIKSKETTRFVLIDLDFHQKNRQEFLQKLESLLTIFHGGTWHYQVAEKDANGVHLIQIFEKPVKTEIAIKNLRQQIAQLPDAHLFSDLEIYPDQNKGVRLPLAAGRTLLLDKAIKRDRKDVVHYVDWLLDHDRDHMSRDDIIEFVSSRLISSKKESAAKSSSKSSQSNAKNWQGNLFKNLTDFWCLGEANSIPLNEHIIVLSRLAAAYYSSHNDIVSGIIQMILQLPEAAKTASGRIANNDLEAISGVIERSVALAIAEQSEAFAQIASKFPDFDPLNTKTWNQVTQSEKTVSISFSDEQKTLILNSLMTVLKIKSEELCLKFVEKMIEVTVNKENKRAWGHAYLQEICKNEFPEIKVGKKEKRVAIFRCLQELRILYQRTRGTIGTASTWQLGAVALESTTVEKIRTTETTSERFKREYAEEQAAKQAEKERVELKIEKAEEINLDQGIVWSDDPEIHRLQLIEWQKAVEIRDKKRANLGTCFSMGDLLAMAASRFSSSA